MHRLAMRSRRCRSRGMAARCSAWRGWSGRAAKSCAGRARGSKVRTPGRATWGGPTRLRPQAHRAVALGIGYVPCARKVEGLVMQMSVAQNLTLPRLRAVSRGGVIHKASERSMANEWIHRLHIKTPGPDASCRNLSGGNQQKVVLAKWRFAGSRILVL